MEERSNEDDTRGIFSPFPRKKGVVWKILIIIIILLSIGVTIYRTSKSVSFGEYYIVDFENTDEELSESEKNVLIKALKLDDEPYFIEFTKIAYEVPWIGDSICYVFFKANSDSSILYNRENTSIKYGKDGGYVYRNIYLRGTDFMVIRQIVKNHYKWREDNEKQIDESKIYQIQNRLNF